VGAKLGNCPGLKGGDQLVLFGGGVYVLDLVISGKQDKVITTATNTQITAMPIALIATGIFFV
jgi:hypothetical protein